MHLRFSLLNRQVKYRVLEKLLAIAARSHLQVRVMGWAALPRFAASSAIAAATLAHMNKLPADEEFASFDALKTRRDATGVVRLR